MIIRVYTRDGNGKLERYDIARCSDIQLARAMVRNAKRFDPVCRAILAVVPT